MELWEVLLSGRRLSSDEGRTAELMCHKGRTDQAMETRDVALYPSAKGHWLSGTLAHRRGDHKFTVWEERTSDDCLESPKGDKDMSRVLELIWVKTQGSPEGQQQETYSYPWWVWKSNGMGDCSYSHLITMTTVSEDWCSQLGVPKKKFSCF